MFQQWGRPQRIRVDNGGPWATWADVPTALALWWVGLGIQPVWNRAYRPTDNARVERCHGVLQAWAEPATCADLPAWQARLDWACQTQRDVYPAVAGQSRAATFPALRENPRPSHAGEPEPFEVARVWQYLAPGRYPRRVSKIGQITLYGQPYAVGRARAGTQVWVRLDAETGTWVIQDEHGAELRRHPAAQLTRARILQLEVAHPRPLSKKEQKRHNLLSEAET